MKKYLRTLIIFVALLVAINHVYAVLSGSPSFVCTSNGGIYKDNECSYVCETDILSVSTSSKDNIGYKQCLAEKERLALEAKQKTFNERNNTLSQYKNFFDQIGVNLTIDTDEEQYNQWLRELKQAKSSYIKEQEDKQQIEDLGNRVKELEEKTKSEVNIEDKNVDSLQIKKIIKPVITESKYAEKIVSKKEINTEVSQVNIEQDNQQQINTTSNQQNIFRKFINWFKLLIE